MKQKCFGFIAGFTGKEIEKKINQNQIESDFVVLKNGISRINVKITDKEETAINAKGPEITEQDIKELFKKFEQIKDKDFVVLSGSIPRNLKEEQYEEICKKIVDKTPNVVMDTTGKYLRNQLKFQPFLIKPNKEELEEIFKTNIRNEKEILDSANQLQKEGAKNILVSLGAEGAILLNEKGNILKARAPKGKRKNTVGAGDSMVAGFLAGYKKSNDYNLALKMGVAAGSASAFSEVLATEAEIMSLKDQIRIKEELNENS